MDRLIAGAMAGTVTFLVMGPGVPGERDRKIRLGIAAAVALAVWSL